MLTAPIGYEDPEVVHVRLHHVAEKNTQRTGVLRVDLTWLVKRYPVRTKVGQSQCLL